MLERSPSHSWWWNSHNSPKHSKWLQSNLQELDEKVKEMLRLIEADADSFAQRAEMYYQKRPELVNLVEEFYRAYRSLAERYDDLTGEIRQNIPRALQLQYGLSCDSPKSTGPTGARLHFSPLRKNHQAFESLLKKAGQAEDIVVDSQQVDQMQTPSPLQTKQDTACDVYAAFLDQNGHNDVLIELEDREKVLSPVRDSTSLASDSDVDNANPLEKLQQEIQVLEKENKMLADSHKKVVELNIALQKSVEALEDRCKMQNKAHGPVSKADELQRSVSSLPEEKTVSMHNKSPLSSNIRDEEKTEQRKFVIKDMVARGCKDRVATDVDAVDTDGCPDVAANYSNGFDYERQGGADNVCAMQPPCLNGGLQNQVALLLQENQSQKLAILEREEEKREAIRQLCFSIDIWKLENQRLEVMLGLMKKRFDATVASHQLFSTWKRVLCLDG